MLPALLPTADLRPMLDFARAGSVAALFFFDDAVLSRRREAQLAAERAAYEADLARNMPASAVKDVVMKRQSSDQLESSRRRQQQKDNNDQQQNQQQQKKQQASTTTLSESTLVCNVLWPITQGSSRDARLDDDETELLLNIQDHGPISRQMRSSRTKSIMMLRDKHRSSTVFSEQYYSATRVGGEEGMRLLLSAIAPRNRLRFGVFGSVVETNSMFERFSGGLEACDESLHAILARRRKYELMRAAIAARAAEAAAQQRNNNSKKPMRDVDGDGDGGMDDMSSGDFEELLLLETSKNEPSMIEFEDSGNKNPQQQQAENQQTQQSQQQSHQQQQQQQAPFFSFGAYIEELRENAVEALGGTVFVHQVSAIMRRVSDFINLSCPSATRQADSKFQSGESYHVDFDGAAFGVSHEDRFHAFSLFFEAGLTYLILGSARLAVGQLVRAASIIAVMLRGENPPPLLLRLRALMCLALTKFFVGFALQRMSLGVEAAQELRRARYLLFDADAMCRAMLRSATSSNSVSGSNSKSKQQHQKRSATTSAVTTLDDICATPEGVQAMQVIRRVARSFVRHCMLHEAHATSSCVVSPLMFHAAGAATNVAGVSKVPEQLRLAVASVQEEDAPSSSPSSTPSRQLLPLTEQQQQTSSSLSFSPASWPAKAHLDTCLRSLHVLDDIADAMHDVATASNSTSAPSSSTTAEKQPATPVVQAATTTTVHDIFVLAETALSLLLAVAFSPDVGAAKQHIHISSVGARSFMPRGVDVATELIHSCANVLRRMYPNASRKDLDVDSPWLLQRPMLRPGVILGALLRHAFLIRAVFHSLRLLWPEAAADLTELVTQIEVAEEPVPRHIYGALKLVNTALMQQRDSVHLVRTTKDVLPPVLPVDESRLSSENDVLLKLLPVIEVLRQTLVDTTAARATVEVNFFSNGVMAERVAWRAFLEQQHGGILVADGLRFEDYGSTQQIRTAHAFEPVTVADVIQARRMSRLESTAASSSSMIGGHAPGGDHRFLLPPFPFSTTVRCDVTGEIVPLQLDSDDASLVLFQHCKACGLRVSPAAYRDFNHDQKRVCIAKLTSSSLCHVGCEVRHCVSAGATSNTRLTVADVLAIKNGTDAEKVGKPESFVARSLGAASSAAASNAVRQQRWEEDWKVGRMRVWDPVSFVSFECQSPQDSLLNDALAETYRRTANNAYEVLLWNPTVGLRPEAEPIVWIMPPNADFLLNKNNNSTNSNEKNIANLRHILASRDIELVLKHHLEHGSADVVPANCLEVIRDRVEDASSDHIHRMVRCRTTRKEAPDALKQSCCVVCNKSLMFSAAGDNNNENDNDINPSISPSVQSRSRDGSRVGLGSVGGRDSLLSAGRASRLTVATTATVGGAESGVGGLAFEVFNLDDEGFGGGAGGGEQQQQDDDDAEVANATGGAGKEDGVESVVGTFGGGSRGASYNNSLMTTPNSVQSNNSSLLQRAAAMRRGSAVVAPVLATDVTTTVLSKDSYLRGTPARAVFFFRCVICGAVAHKHCGNANQESTTTEAVLLEQRALDRQHKHQAGNQAGASSRAAMKAVGAAQQQQQKQQARFAPSVVDGAGGELTPALSQLSALRSSPAVSVLSRRSLEPEKQEEQHQQLQDDVKQQPTGKASVAALMQVRHPLRIVNEHFDIDSLNSLRQEHDRMETAESAALRSGETLRRWVENDRAGGVRRDENDDDHDSGNPNKSINDTTDSFAVGGGASAAKNKRRASSAFNVAAGLSQGGYLDDSLTNLLMNDSNADPAGFSASAAAVAATTTAGGVVKRKWQSPQRAARMLLEKDKKEREKVLSRRQHLMQAQQEEEQQRHDENGATPEHNNPDDNNKLIRTAGLNDDLDEEERAEIAARIAAEDKRKQEIEAQHEQAARIAGAEHERKFGPASKVKYLPEDFVQANKKLDETTILLLFRENCDEATQRMPLENLDRMCSHIGVTGGQLVEKMARRYGLERRMAEILGRGLPVDGELAGNDNNNNSNTGNFQEQLQGLTLVEGSLSFEEFALAMMLIAQD